MDAISENSERPRDLDVSCEVVAGSRSGLFSVLSACFSSSTSAGYGCKEASLGVDPDSIISSGIKLMIT